jgi:hypothetical protein
MKRRWCSRKADRDRFGVGYDVDADVDVIMARIRLLVSLADLVRRPCRSNRSLTISYWERWYLQGDWPLDNKLP